jgi:peptidoglycan-associated lipoprotein
MIVQLLQETAMFHAARPVRAAALATVAAFATLSTSACATKKYVNRQVEGERLARTAADSAQGRDVAAIRADLTALRGELTTLRTEFGTRITAMENSVKFAMPVHFAFGEAAVRPEDQAALDRFASVVNKYYNGAELTVAGFADPAGPTRFNLALSRRRAESVREYIVGKGVSEQLVRTVGYGEARQVRPGAAGDAQGAELNRRVVFVIETPGAGTATTAALSGDN